MEEHLSEQQVSQIATMLVEKLKEYQLELTWKHSKGVPNEFMLLGATSGRINNWGIEELFENKGITVDCTTEKFSILVADEFIEGEPEDAECKSRIVDIIPYTY